MLKMTRPCSSGTFIYKAERQIKYLKNYENEACWNQKLDEGLVYGFGK